jgi:ABC-type phosphate transport system auxiliary subunit
MMKEAEAGVDNRQELNVGGMLGDPKLDVDPNGQPVEGDMVEDEIRKGMLSANPRLRQR